jgi:hypothetical protein
MSRCGELSSAIAASSETGALVSMVTRPKRVHPVAGAVEAVYGTSANKEYANPPR